MSAEAPLLEAEGLTRRFGGLVAVDNVDLALHRGRIHAVIGPNGAGKTTLINLLSGDAAPSAGTIRFLGRDITRASPDQRARAGLGRSYQKTNIFPAFSAFENARLAAQARARASFGLIRPAAAYGRVNQAAAAALEAVGLAARAATPAYALAHGEQRALEIAMVLATAPEAILLDEPLAGMGAEESRAALPLLRRLAEAHAVLLVEHDMDAVFEVADTLTVMVNGRVLRSGPPEEVRRDSEVRRAYLGEADG